MRRCPRWRELDAEQRKEYWASLALRHCRGLGARSCFKLVCACGSAHAAVQRNAEWTAFGLRPEPGAALRSGAWRVTAREEWDAAVRLNPRILLWTDPLYPPLLRMLPDAPLILYCDGDVSLLTSPCFAVVGARKAGDQARAVAAHMAQYLAAGGLAVVSGMAQGIDAVVHGSALRQIGRSIGVLGTGIDIAYPQSNRGLFERMRRDGLLLSEFAINAGWFVPETVLLTAFITIAGFSLPSFEMGYAMKFERLLLLVLTQLFGVWGIAGGTLLIFVCMLNIKTLSGRNYLYPLVPFNLKAFTELFIRYPAK